MATFTFDMGTPASGPSSATLQAVNEMLEKLGEPPVVALDTGGSSLEAEAENILLRTSRRIQARGWYANTASRSYTPDSDGYIDLPNVLKVEGGYAIRSGRLYSLEKSSSTFDNPVQLQVVELLDLGDLPEKLREYIVKSACLEWQRYKKRGQVDDAMIRDEVARAYAEVMIEESDYLNVDLLQDETVEQVKGGRTEYRG